jgi:hypothetical protein
MKKFLTKKLKKNFKNLLNLLKEKEIEKLILPKDFFYKVKINRYF